MEKSTKIKTLEDVAMATKTDLVAFNTAIMGIEIIPVEERQYIIDHFTWTKIAQALNEEWLADYTNYKQGKYYPYVWQVKKDPESKSGFGFSYSSTRYVRTLTLVGARSLFKTPELAAYALKTWPDIYIGWMIKNREVAA
jgi:hypothetical protein